MVIGFDMKVMLISVKINREPNILMRFIRI